MEEVGIGLIGTGFMGKCHATAYNAVRAVFGEVPRPRLEILADTEPEVAAARADSDTVVVFLHWGTEGELCPTDRQRSLATTLVDAGADIVVGGHAHRVQSAGRLGGALVGYGLGNFVWYAPPGPSSETGVLLVTATGRSIDGYRWEPARITNGTPAPLEAGSPAAAEAVATWDERRACTGLEP